jgi:DNA repair exonuclease SbcCD ATPase subunit
MRIESVTAHAFGPLVDETLNLAPGMTVVVGDNESAKSSWHAAIYSALCGRARRRGRMGADEQLFSELHKPWDSEAWEVSAVLVMDDGRRIELRHDLAGNADSSAKDLQMARDVSDEIMDDGSPDAAIWLGLDRRSFVATACIHQAQLLEVLTEAKGLQTVLQRAASTAGTDATAAEALRRLDIFQREHVGKDDARSTRALRKAVGELGWAKEALRAAEAFHAEYLEAVEEVERLRYSASEAEQDVALHEAADARRLVDDLRGRCRRVAELRDRLGDASPPQATEADAMATKVARALEAWRNRPEPAMLDGPSAATLREQIAGLPEMPVGDLAVHADVETAATRLARATQALELHDQDKPTLPDMDLPAVSQEEVLGLAHALGLVPPTPAAASSELEALTDDIRRLEAIGRRSRVLVAVGITVVMAGAVLASVGPRAAGSLAAVGFVMVIAGVVRRKGRELQQARARHSGLSIQAVANHDAAARFTEDCQRAEERCARLGVPAVASELQGLAAALSRQDTYAEQIRAWEDRQLQLVNARVAADANLRDALITHRVPIRDNSTATFADYALACGVRAEVAAQASKRQGLEAQLAERTRAEDMAVQRNVARTTSAEQVLEAARACALPDGTPEEAVSGLQCWEERRQAELRALDARRQEWTELETILGGRTPQQLAEALRAAEANAAIKTVGLDPERVKVLSADSRDSALSTLRNTAREAGERAATAEGALDNQAKRLPSVAEAEEALSRAQDHLSWIQELDETLTVTMRFMADAQELVQRNLAPVLTATLKAWLPRVTSNRYSDVIIDLDTLNVQVCGTERRWRQANRLSHGTSEQIYLLLRTALARHLTAGRDSCPLLLDDVTVQADRQRTIAILDLLHELSVQQQVILFAEERTVAEWAKAHLPSAALHRLDVVKFT